MCQQERKYYCRCAAPSITINCRRRNCTRRIPYRGRYASLTAQCLPESGPTDSEFIYRDAHIIPSICPTCSSREEDRLALPATESEQEPLINRGAQQARPEGLHARGSIGARLRKAGSTLQEVGVTIRKAGAAFSQSPWFQRVKKIFGSSNSQARRSGTTTVPPERTAQPDEEIPRGEQTAQEGEVGCSNVHDAGSPSNRSSPSISPFKLSA